MQSCRVEPSKVIWFLDHVYLVAPKIEQFSANANIVVFVQVFLGHQQTRRSFYAYDVEFLEQIAGVAWQSLTHTVAHARAQVCLAPRVSVSCCASQCWLALSCGWSHTMIMMIAFALSRYSALQGFGCSDTVVIRALLGVATRCRHYALQTRYGRTTITDEIMIWSYDLIVIMYLTWNYHTDQPCECDVVCISLGIIVHQHKRHLK